MPDEFHGDETLLTSHEILVFSLLTMSIKMKVFNVMKPFMKLSLKLALLDGQTCREMHASSTESFRHQRRRPYSPADEMLVQKCILDLIFKFSASTVRCLHHTEKHN